MKTVTYTDLERAAPEVEVHGVVFHDGQPVDVDDSIADALQGNRFFSEGPQDHVGDGLDGMGIAELRAEADERQIGHDGKSKAQLREAIRAFDAAL